ncbi:MAG: hypothetical protein FJ296_01130 [Planctomycetes bacterium]|nr:hypothetical protein [Planctomycetota bacterium]
MLPSLLLSLALLPLQDAPAAEPAAAAPAVPTETSEGVRAFLQEAESHLYDPQAAGLSSLEFDVAVEIPNVGVLGTAHVSWSTTGPAAVSVARDAAVVAPPGLPEGMADDVGRQIGLQLLGAMLNKPITPMLENSVAYMDGVEDGLVKVRLHTIGMSEQGIEEQAIYFNDDGVLQRLSVKARVDSPMGGKMDVSQSQTFTWRPASEGAVLLVADAQASVVDMGFMKSTGSTSFRYTDVGGILLLTSMTMTQPMPMMPEPVVQTLAATNLKVNGAAAGAPAAPPAGG